MRSVGSFNTQHGPSLVDISFSGLDAELRTLRTMVTKYRATPNIRDLAMYIITEAGAESRDEKAQATAIGNWVQANIYYVHELPERFQTPTETLRSKAGDCDDFTVLVCSLLESLGIPSALICMSINGKWAHIFSGAWINKGGVRTLMPVDATMKDPIDTIPNPVDWAKSRGKAVTLKIA